MYFCLLGSNGLDFGFRWVGFWILMGFGLDLNWFVWLGWRVGGMVASGLFGCFCYEFAGFFVGIW